MPGCSPQYLSSARDWSGSWKTRADKRRVCRAANQRLGWIWDEYRSRDINLKYPCLPIQYSVSPVNLRNLPEHRSYSLDGLFPL
jgi:hypothetical protein